MRLLLLTLTLLSLASCSSHRTKYQVYNKKEGGGYSEEKFEDGLSMINFRGNSLTKKSYAELFAKFRAIEICLDAGKKYAHLVGMLDRSESRTVTRSSGNVYGFPSYYYGYPYYSRYSGFAFGASFNTLSSNSWDETYTYPNLDVLYRCEDVVYEPEVIFREVPATEVKHLVKDLKGALQVEKLIDGSPNKKIQENDIILKAAGERIEKNWQILKDFDQKTKSIPLDALREGEKTKLVMEAKNVSEAVGKTQQDIIQSACKFDEIKERALCKAKL